MGESKKETFETKFAPMLLHKDGIAAIEFYKKAFSAKEVQRWTNEDALAARAIKAGVGLNIYSYHHCILTGFS